MSAIRKKKFLSDAKINDLQKHRPEKKNPKKFASL